MAKLQKKIFFFSVSVQFLRVPPLCSCKVQVAVEPSKCCPRHNTQRHRAQAAKPPSSAITPRSSMAHHQQQQQLHPWVKIPSFPPLTILSPGHRSRYESIFSYGIKDYFLGSTSRSRCKTFGAKRHAIATRQTDSSSDDTSTTDGSPNPNWSIKIIIFLFNYLFLIN